MKNKILKNKDEIETFFEEFNSSLYAYDTETTDLRYDLLEIIGISFYDGDSACYIPIKDDNREEIIKALKDTIFKEVSEHSIICHNIVFDMKVLAKYGIDLTKAKWKDTMVMSHLVDETLRSNGLKNLTEQFLKRSVVRYAEVDSNLYSNKFMEYAIADAVNTFDLYNYFLPILKENELEFLFLNIEMPFMKALLEMKIEGVDIDTKLLSSTTIELEKAIIDFQAKLYEAIDEPYGYQKDLFQNNCGITGSRNFNSSKDLADILFNKLGFDIIEETETGLPKTGKITIATYRDKHKFVEILEQYKIAQKLLSAFFKPLPSLIQKDNKVRGNFKDVGTKTGRLSSSNPNLQQLPKENDKFPIDTRGVFIVPKGYKMITCDYSGQELRVLAQVSGDNNLIKAFNDNADLHLFTANKSFNLKIPDEALVTSHPEYESYKDKFGKERFNAKAINFGIVYGIGGQGLGRQIGCTEDEGDSYIQGYFKGYPKVKRAMDLTKQKVMRDGWVKTLVGRRRHFDKADGEDYYPNSAFRQSFNFLIQSFSADMVRMAANACYRLEKDNPDWGLKMLMTVHDEIVFKVKEEYAEVASKEVKLAFEGVVNFKVPIVADVKIGNNYGEAK